MFTRLAVNFDINIDYQTDVPHLHIIFDQNLANRYKILLDKLLKTNNTSFELPFF